MLSLTPRTSYKLLSAALLCLALFVPPSLWAQGGLTKGQATKGVVASPTVVVVPPTTVGQIFISELRLAGPNGTKDEFIELFNNTGVPLVVQAADASPGLGIAASDGVLRCTVPNGTIIPTHGHFLCANTDYSLSNYGGTGNAAPDAVYTLDIPANVGIALFNTTNPANFNLANRLDAVGSEAEANSLYVEDAGYSFVEAPTNEHSLYRAFNPNNGLPLDSNSNHGNFVLVDSLTNSLFTNSRSVLGAPGPENLASPIQRNATIKASLLSPCLASKAAPNYIRTGSGNSGTLSIRRKFINSTGAPVTRLRFRITDITTREQMNCCSHAILRAVTSADSVEMQPCDGGTVAIQGLTLEQTPPAQPVSGGFNSSLAASTVTLATPLLNGETINVNFLLNVDLAGTFRFFVNVEALP